MTLSGPGSRVILRQLSGVKQRRGTGSENNKPMFQPFASFRPRHRLRHISLLSLVPLPTSRTRNDKVISDVGKRMKLVLTVLTLAILGTGFPIHAKAADNDDNASKCNNLALKAHPSSLPDIPAVANLRHDYYTLCMARHGNMGVVDPGTATAAPRDHFDGGYVGPGIGIQVDRSPRPGDAGCWARGLVRTPVGLRSRFIYTC